MKIATSIAMRIPMSIHSRRLRPIAAAVAAACVASQAGAQQPWLQFASPFVSPIVAPYLGVASTPNRAFSPSASSIILQPGAHFETSRSSMLAQVSAALNESAPRFDNANLETRTLLWRPGGVETALLASGQYDCGCFVGGASSNVSTRLQIGSASPSRGLQLGVGTDAWQSNIVRSISPAATFSAWARRFGVTITTELNAHTLTLTPRNPADTGILVFPDSGQRALGDTLPIRKYSSSAGRHFGDTRVRFAATILSVGIDAELGRTLVTSGGSRNFGSLMLTRRVSPMVALTAGLLVQPANPGVAARRGAVLGLRLSGARELLPRLVNAPKPTAMLTTVRFADTSATIDMAAPGANSVEVSGDFTQWNPVALERQAGDRWALTTPITPGVHHFVVRVNGGNWQPPPGLPQATDLYEGVVGVIVAPERSLAAQH
jgi:hypothetical protein